MTRTIGTSIALIFAALVFAILADKHLSADGANYFTTILRTGDFTHVDWTRQFANYWSQLVLVLFLKSGFHDIPTLRVVFGLGLLVPWALAIALSLYSLRREDKSVFLFMLVSMVSVNLFSDYILAGEHHVMTLFSWPILFFLLRRAELSWSDAGILWTLCFSFTRLYPTAVVPALLFILVGAWRAIRSPASKQRIILVGTIVLLGVCVAVSASAIIDPRSISNRASFSAAIGHALATPEAMAAIAFLALFLAGLFWRKRTLLWMSLAPVAVFSIYAAAAEYIPSAHSSFAARSLSLTLLPALLAGATVVSCKRLRPGVGVGAVVGLFVLAMVSVNVASTMGWRSYRADMLAVLGGNTGMVPLEGTILASSRHRWSWNNKQLSVIWSDGCVQSVVLNERGVRWQPKGPPDYYPLRNYSCYGAFFRGYDPDLCPCLGSGLP
mgnify:CR=1 FL=1